MKRSENPGRTAEKPRVSPTLNPGYDLPLVKDVVTRLRDAGLADVPVVVGGIIPPDDAAALKESGVAAVYTPKDFELNQVMTDVLRIVERSQAE